MLIYVKSNLRKGTLQFIRNLKNLPYTTLKVIFNHEKLMDKGNSERVH